MSSLVKLDEIDETTIQQCTNVKKIKEIIALLEKEPYPELLSLARAKLDQLTGVKPPSHAENAAAIEEVNKWTEEMQRKDAALKDTAMKVKSEARELPPIPWHLSPIYSATLYSNCF